MNRIAMLLASTLAVAPTSSFADVSGPTKPGARASYQPSRATTVAVPTFHPSWQKAALWAQARVVPASTRSNEATSAVSWRDTGVKAALWRAPQSVDGSAASVHCTTGPWDLRAARLQTQVEPRSSALPCAR